MGSGLGRPVTVVPSRPVLERDGICEEARLGPARERERFFGVVVGAKLPLLPGCWFEAEISLNLW